MGRKKTRHHRKPKHQGGTDDRENIKYVTDKKHKAWHVLFSGTMKVPQIAHQLNNTWIDPDYVLIPFRRLKVLGKYYEPDFELLKNVEPREIFKDPNQLSLPFP